MTLSLEEDRDALLEQLTRLSFERRAVTLSSGRTSDFYIDCKRTALTAAGHCRIGRLLYDRLTRLPVRVKGVGGPTLGADPLASAISLTSHLAGGEIAAFIVRKEPKGHGTAQWIEGLSNLAAGDPVAIVEDVVTTGASTMKAIERAEACGLVVVAVLALVDRLEGGREALKEKGYELSALFTRDDFMR